MGTSSIADLEAKLAAASEEPVDAVARVDALNALAWALRNPDVTRAHKLAIEARDAARDCGYVLGEARATRTMAMSVGSAEQIEKVFGLAREAKRLFDESGDLVGRAASRDFLASLLEHAGDLAGGLEYALDALDLARASGDLVRQGYALSSVGGILAASGEVDAAVERLDEGLAIFRKLEDPMGMGTMAHRLAVICLKADRRDEALLYAERCLEAAKTTRNDIYEHAGNRVMATLADRRGDAAEAERLYRAAIGVFEDNSAAKLLSADTRSELADLLVRGGRLDEAEALLREVVAMVEGRPLLVVAEATAHQSLAKVFEHRGDFEQTLVHLREHQRLREQIVQSEARNKMAQVEARAAREAAEKDAEIQRLRFVELHGMQAKLVEAEKMAVVGNLAAGTAHELHTPLGVLRSNGKLVASATARLLAELGDDAALSDRAKKLTAVLESCAQTSDDALERIAAIAHSLGRFSQRDRAAHAEVDVRECLDSAIALLRPTVPEAIAFERRYESVPPITGSAQELNHAFLTVLQNAAEAIDEAGTVTIETRTDGDDLVVTIRDDGRGMGEEARKHLFDVTWSEDGQRIKMRLGLSAAYATAQAHGGRIDVDSTLGEGSVFTFRLPIAAT